MEKKCVVGTIYVKHIKIAHIVRIFACDLSFPLVETIKKKISW